MEKALLSVPFEPAYDFYSALQSVWLVAFIAGCYVGSRDYAFGRLDEYLFPYYQKDLENGATEEKLTELLAGFFVGYRLNKLYNNGIFYFYTQEYGGETQ